MMKNKATHILTKIAVNIGRLLMAITFIFSGFVKGIDPLGTQYKITDKLVSGNIMITVMTLNIVWNIAS